MIDGEPTATLMLLAKRRICVVEVMKMHSALQICAVPVAAGGGSCIGAQYKKASSNG